MLSRKWPELKSGFIPLAVDTTGRMYDEFIRLLFLYAHLEASALTSELSEELVIKFIRLLFLYDHREESVLTSELSRGVGNQSPPFNLVYVRRVDPSALDFSLSSHRHFYMSSVYLSFYYFIINNQTMILVEEGCKGSLFFLETFMLGLGILGTHIRFGCSHLYPMGQLTNIRHSDGAPEPD
jgi:hypothetical protein